MFFDESGSSTNGVVYGLTNKARCISALWGDKENTRFLVGTQSIKEENEVHLVELQEEEQDIKVLKIYGQFPGEIWSLEASPVDPSLFFTCHANTTPQQVTYTATLWRMHEHEQQVEEVLHLPTVPQQQQQEHNHIQWSKEGTECLVVGGNKCTVWALRENATEEGNCVVDDSTEKLQVGKWNPLHSDKFATAGGSAVRGWDKRAYSESFVIPSAHFPFVRDLDYNPNKDYHLMTCGDDYKMKFWDTRKLTKPIKSFSGHSHWVINSKYNGHYDQLILTSSTDTMVNLWNVASVSSSPGSIENSDYGSKKYQDHLVKTFDEHEDSVYSITWSTDTWTFASLSYDGRVVINTVPREYSDQILM